MSRQRMPAGDAAWLHMDRHTNRLIVNSVMWCDEPLDWAAVGALLQERLLARFPRFTQRVVDHRTGVWWEDDDTFRLDRHVRRAALPAPGRVEQLQEYVSSVAGQALDRSGPLWETHFVDGLEGGGSALVTRIHHCIADGVALARVMLSLTDDPQDARGADVAAVGDEHTGGVTGAERLVAAVVDDVREPGRALGQVSRLAADARAGVRLFGLPPDARTSLHARVGELKQVVWSRPVPLDALRTAARAVGVTVNDLVLAAVAGALRAYLARMDGRAPDVRAVIPVNLRPPGAPLPAELGNDFGLAYLALPSAVDDRRERLTELRRRTLALKRSPEAAVALATLRVVGHLPYKAEQLFVEAFTTKASAVITNVVGPARPVYLAGRRMRGTIAWPPESGALALGISIISYDGNVLIGVIADTQVVQEPRRLLVETIAELDQLLDLCAADAAAAK